MSQIINCLVSLQNWLIVIGTLKNEERKESKNDRLDIDLVSMATGYESNKEMRR